MTSLAAAHVSRPGSERVENNHLSLVFKAFFFFLFVPAHISLHPCAPLRYRHTLSLGSVAIMCGFCKPPQSLEATKGCADCKSNFCNECFKLYHPWGTPRAQHEHILPTNNFRPKVCLRLSRISAAAAALSRFRSSPCFRFSPAQSTSRRGCSGTATTARGYCARSVSSGESTTDTGCCLLLRPTRNSR